MQNAQKMETSNKQCESSCLLQKRGRQYLRHYNYSIKLQHSIVFSYIIYNTQLSLRIIFELDNLHC